MDKNVSKDVYNVQINAVLLLNFLFNKEFEKICMMDSSKTLIKTTDFNIDNNKTRFRALNQHI